MPRETPPGLPIKWILIVLALIAATAIITYYVVRRPSLLTTYPPCCTLDRDPTKGYRPAGTCVPRNGASCTLGGN